MVPLSRCGRGRRCWPRRAPPSPQRAARWFTIAQNAVLHYGNVLPVSMAGQPSSADLRSRWRRWACSSLSSIAAAVRGARLGRAPGAGEQLGPRGVERCVAREGVGIDPVELGQAGVVAVALGDGDGPVQARPPASGSIASRWS